MAFIPRRRGVDNVIIAHELIHSLHKKKGRKGYFILKIDLEKAYDRLEWSFIHKVLLYFNFPTKLVDLILKCVSSSSISILFNGGQLEVFKPTRGIRQGDPLSPYLFILCMEYLSLKISNACMDKSWKPIKASRSGPRFLSPLSLQMIFYFVLRPLLVVVILLIEFWMIFVLILGKRST
jgi:hypothetical protein